MARSLVAPLVLLLAPAVRADIIAPFTASFTGTITGITGNVVTNPNTGQPLDLAPDLLGMSVQGTLTQAGTGLLTLDTNLLEPASADTPVTPEVLASGYSTRFLAMYPGEHLMSFHEAVFPSITQTDSVASVVLNSLGNGGQLTLNYVHNFSNGPFGPTGPIFIATVDYISTQIVPEPSSMLLLGVGLAGLGALTLRRRTGIRRAA